MCEDKDPLMKTSPEAFRCECSKGSEPVFLEQCDHYAEDCFSHCECPEGTTFATKEIGDSNGEIMLDHYC